VKLFITPFQRTVSAGTLPWTAIAAVHACRFPLIGAYVMVAPMSAQSRFRLQGVQIPLTG
jgi:hypothetical protein